MSASLFRSILRWFHIIVAFFVGAYFYSPIVPTLSWSLPLIKFGLIPLLMLSGLALWKQAKLMKWINRKQK